MNFQEAAYFYLDEPGVVKLLNLYIPARNESTFGSRTADCEMILFLHVDDYLLKEIRVFR